MARRINSRLIIKGTLEALTPLHVGGYGVDVDTDLPLSRNGKGELYVPGTSLTGVLRAWCERNFGNVGEIFGFQKDESGQASFVLIEDAKVDLPKGLQTEIRDGVGIDRFYGTAAEGAKYDRAILPKGSSLDFEMIVEIEDRKLKPKDKRKNNKDYEETEEQFDSRIKETKAIFGNLLEALENEEIRFGASKTRGLGRVKFSLTEIEEENLQGFDNILALFDDSTKPKYSIQNLIDVDSETKPNSNNSSLKITIEWHPTLPLMNKAGYEGIGVDMLPVTSGFGEEKLSLVLAGSSIKGVFRSQAERIMRTLLNLTAKDKDFNEQIDEIKIVEELFGARKKKPKDSDDETEKERKKRLGLGALSIDDCYSVESFNQNDWGEVEQSTADSEKSSAQWELTTALGKIEPKMTNQTKFANPHFHISHHTAIDRFTGGVAEGALYSVLAPHNIEWQPIELYLDFGRTDNQKPCLMLLLLVLRDLAENRLPLGFATNRGMGEVEIEKIEIKGSYNIVWENGQFFFADESQKITIGKDWQEFIKLFQNQLVSKNIEEIMPEKQNLEEQETLIFDSEKQKTGDEANSLSEQETLIIGGQSKYFDKKRDPYKIIGDIYADRYELEEYAGHGGMGVVYRAKDRQENKQVAIKIIRPEIVADNPQLLKKFQREVIITQQLSHPNIIQALDNGETEDGTTFMVMEWLEGRTLQSVINEEHLSNSRILSIFAQVCLGIAEAHRNRILHLDIKPFNVFWFNDNDVKVIDFGLAKVIESETGILVTELVGTREYCSPEHFSRNRKFTKQSDIYSLGIMLYHMSSGNLDPFDNDYIDAKKISESLIPSLPSLAELRFDLAVFDPIIEKAIKKNPLERYNSVEELLKDFEEVLNKPTVEKGEQQND